MSEGRSTIRALQEIIALVGLLVTVLSIWMSWNSLPAMIPIHFGLNGTPDGFAGRGFLWLLPEASVLLYGALFVVGLFPRFYSLPVPVGDPRRPQLEALASQMLGWIKAEVMWLFAFLTWMSIRAARHQSSGLGVATMPCLALLVLSTVAIYLVRGQRLKARLSTN
jgi:uncharacterized membrane protein